MANYDAKTTNGIPYISTLYAANFKYQTVVDDLDELYPQKKSILSGGSVTAYTIGDRSITKSQLSPDAIIKRWDKLMAEKNVIESGGKSRKAVAVVHRDW